MDKRKPLPHAVAAHAQFDAIERVQVDRRAEVARAHAHEPAAGV
jgi:hypothetical protein